jgi:hypothetical protein
MLAYGARTTTTGILLLVAAALAGGCATDAVGPPTSYRAVDHIDERPARLVGKAAELTIENGVLTGHLERGQYRAQITPDSARGYGPMGPIDVHIKRLGKAYDVSGMWNGGDLHFVVGENGAQGTAFRQISYEDRGYENCRYDIEKLKSGAGYSGLSECLGMEEPLRFEVQPKLTSDLTDEQNVVLLVAYLAAPPAVRMP